MNIQSLVSDFANQIESLVRQDVESRMREVLAGITGKRGPGRPPGKRGPGRPPGKRGPGRPPGKPVKKISKPVTAKQARQRKLQGQYLGAIRHLPGADSAKVKAVAKKDGVAAAVTFAKKLKK